MGVADSADDSAGGRAAAVRRLQAPPATSTARNRRSGKSSFDNYRVSVKVSFIQCIDSGLRLVVVRHFNVAKAPGFASVLVHHNFCGINFPKSFESFPQVFTRCPEVESCNKNIHVEKVKKCEFLESTVYA